MNVLTAVIGAALLVMGQHSAMPQGMSHEEHMKQIQNDEALKKRGADAMGFDQDATIHHFRLAEAGGTIEVTVKDEASATVVPRVRLHLETIADEFARGDFRGPLETHAEIPPGVAVMQERAGAISYRYEDLPRGGALRIRTSDAVALEAVHAFLRYQMAAHRTGDPSGVKR